MQTWRRPASDAGDGTTGKRSRRHRTTLRVAGVLAVAATAGLAAPRAAAAQLFGGGVVYCTNCGSEVTQLVNKVQLVQQYAKQVQQYSTQLQQYADQVRNTARVPTQVWGSTMASLQQVHALYSNAQSLAYTMANLNQQFGQRYKTYGVYAGQTLTPATMSQKYQQWSAEANDNVLLTLRAANAQATQLGGEDADLRALEQMATTADGRMKALQVGTQFAAQSARQLQKLRQLMLLNLQLQANAQQTAQDRAAYQQAAVQRLLTAPQSASNGGQRF